MVRTVGSSVEREKESVRLSGSLGFLQGKRETERGFQSFK